MHGSSTPVDYRLWHLPSGCVPSTQKFHTRPFGVIARIAPVSLGVFAKLPVTGLNQDQLCTRIPLGRLGKVEEVADAAAFLARNTYANNCVLTVDGGLSAGFS